MGQATGTAGVMSTTLDTPSAPDHGRLVYRDAISGSTKEFNETGLIEYRFGKLASPARRHEQTRRWRVRGETDMTHTFPAYQPIEATVHFAAGLCIVSTSDDDATVRVEPFDPGRREDVEAAANLVIDCDGKQLKIIAKKKLLGKVTGIGVGRLKLWVNLPPESSVILRTESAAIEISDGTLADLNVNTGSGPISVDYISRNLRIDTSDSRIRVGQVDGDVLVDNGSGSMDIELANGHVEMSGSSSDLTIGSAAGSVRFSSGSGSLVIGAASGTAVEARTSSGKISIGVPVGIGVRPRLKSSGGTKSGALIAGADRVSGNHWLDIKVDTASGDIDIHPFN
ncbi:DUF4097 family beta strand repeat-containing protein [Streptosporangium sp. 'caverna']|uniref:DUF4097 family beta strand repeat-containing protein n=1 Tax=Streptosporangium sp. 'caverna' TaxID=2202249 RepID=UPI000D7E0FAC|nr:DUF4097 family beta strand repeat-containing protein [Streptosporangium sp. 'caverna']AWS44263.1 hypothetical protein DKM19_25855 [Streptosporangium sp. 'caverna']